MKNLENQNKSVMNENSDQKLVVLEDDSCIEVPESDGENMPVNRYEFNTKKHQDVTNKHLDVTDSTA